VVTVAIAGRGDDGSERTVTAPSVDASAPGPVEASPSYVADAPPASTARPTRIVLDVPGRPLTVVTTTAVVIRGQVPRDAGRLQILLQTRAATPIVVVTAEPMSAARTGWHEAPATFAADLALPDPRPTGPAVIQIVSYDQRGRARDVLLRPIIIGQVARRPIGEDGLLGGIVFGVPMEDRVGGD
jgi:hypothetical protein